MAIRNKRFPSGYEFSKFALGYNNVGVPGSLKPGALADCKNFNITRQGKLTKRNGCTKYQTTACGSTAPVNSIYEYKSPGGAVVSTYILVASGTVIYSYYSSTWNPVLTGQAAVKHSFVTHLGLCIGANGTNANFKIYSDGVNLTGTPSQEALSATAFSLGIPAPTTDPVSGYSTVAYTSRYLDTADFGGFWDFAEFNSKLMTYDPQGKIIQTTNGTTWTTAFTFTGDPLTYLTQSGKSLTNTGRSMAVYDSKLFISTYNQVDSVAVTAASWDGSTGQATYLWGGGTNWGVYDFVNFDDNLFFISDYEDGQTDADTRIVGWYNGTADTAIADYDGASDLTYNTSSNHLEFIIRHRASRLFVFQSKLYMIASRYDGSAWEWEVWLFNQNSYTSFEKIYAGAADGYVLSAVWSQDDTTVYAIGNTLSSGAAQDVAKLYSSTDMITWVDEGDFAALGFVMGEAEFDDRIYIHAQENTANESKIWRFDEDDKIFILDSILSANPADGLKGGIYGWSNLLHVGGWKNIWTRDSTGLSGTYSYKYTYKRESWKPFEGNPSDATDEVEFSLQSGTCSVTASAQTDVNKIVLYRTTAEGALYYKHSEVANTTATITDTTHDDDLTTLLETDNTVPPKATYLCLHNNRVIYLNCPDETDGGSLVMWSKLSYGEAVPSANYQYFDREDGEDITGGASIGDYLVVFKRNKFSVLSGDFDESSELYTTGYGIGCVSHHTIIPFEDKVVFLSEEGWKAFDGRNLYSMSEFVDGWRDDGYYTPTEAAGYQSVYYSDREQFLTLMEHSSETDIMAVGHFLIPLTMADQGAPEFGTGVVASWTYHTYANHVLTTIGTYTDSSDITRVLAGDSTGYVYVLDSGTADVNAAGTSNAIPYTFQTDWSTLGTERYETKVCRRGYLAYTSSTTDTATFNIEKDFSDTDDNQTITCVTSGVSDAHIQKLHLTGTGEVFRFTLTGSAQQALGIIALQIYFRNLGIRP